MTLAEIVGWASMVCLQDATAWALALFAPPAPALAPPEVVLAGVEGVRATVGLAVAGVGPGAGAEAVFEGVLGAAVRVPPATLPGAAAEFLLAGVEDFPAATGLVLAARLVLAAGPVRAAGLVAAGVELV